MRPKILFLTTELPWPVDGGGKLRTFETLACLLRFADVRLLAVSDAPTRARDAIALAGALPGLQVESPIHHPIRIRRKPAALARTALLQLLRNEPYLVAKFRSAPYLAEAGHLASSWRPDVVWCDHLNVFPAATLAAERAAAPLVLDQHNVESDLFRRAAGASPWQRRLAAMEGERLARYETAALRRADRVIAISDDDAERFRALLGTGAVDHVVTVLPSMGELGEAPPPPPASRTVTFLGTLSWPPNAEGVAWMAREVLPALRRLVPDVRARVGGRGLAPALQREAEAAGLELAGWVDDPVAFMREAAAVVVPILSGSGISMKVLDAMRAGVPIVSTPAGVRGLDVEGGRQVLLASTAEEFADATARLLGDDALRARLVAEAWDYLLARHGRQALSERYQGVVEAALGG